jgi:hypothetical protein
VRMGMPRGPRAWREAHERGGEGRAVGRGGDGVDVDLAGEPVGGALLGPMLLRVMCMRVRFRWGSGGLAAVDDHGVTDGERCFV